MRPSSTIRLIFFVGTFLTLSVQGWSQKKQLTASDKVIKIGLIDHSRLRKEFKAFDSARISMAKVNKSKKVSFEQALQLIEQQAKDQLKRDSLSGGKKREQVISLFDSKRSALINDYQSDQKKRIEDRIALMREYERQITVAIDKVVSEGGFTDVRPLGKDSTNSKGVNITELILKKLN